MATFLRFTPCCNNTLHYDFQPLEGIDTPAVYIYTGTDVYKGVILPDQCYTIISLEGSSEYVSGLSESPVDLSLKKGCDDLKCLDCPTCYKLYNCEDNEVIYTYSDLATNVGDFVKIFDSLKCWYVSVNVGDCINPIEVVVNAEIPCACAINCYNITGNPSTVTYVDIDNIIHTQIGGGRICSKITPYVVGGTGSVVNLGSCVDGDCPDVCFKFTNCQTLEELIVSNTTAILNYYVDNKIVTLNGYDGCWSIDVADTCDCAVNVTILTAHDSCVACLPTVAYKFTNCNNQTIVKYSTDDYSSYIDKTVILDCGECWTVSLIDFIPPAVQPITILLTYDNCLECSRTYYKLTDCNIVESPIITYTDLSLFVGKVIKIKGCDACWTVETTTDATNASTIELIDSYDTCVECGDTAVCYCSIAWPEVNGSLSYVDCEGVTVSYTGLDPDQPTERLCVRKWLIARKPIYYGECVNGVCPPKEQPKRKVIPGYSVPTCDPEKYEKISCKSSEILYKSVLQKRYGISNCCPDEDDKWLIKKELIDLDGMRDPNYTCTSPSSCCGSSTCDCGCNGYNLPSSSGTCPSV